MLLKKICSKYSSTEKLLFDKKLLNKKLYGKVLLRNSNILSTTSCQLDDSFGNFNVSRSLLIKNIVYKKNVILSGRSFFLKDFVYLNRFNKYLKFKGLLAVNQTKLSFSNSFSKLLDKLQNFKRNSSMFVLSPIKGGFTCYSSGVIGFLPRSHLKLILLKIFNFFKQEIKYLRSPFYSINFVINKKQKIKIFSVLRTLFCWGQIALYSPHTHKNFSKTNKIRHFSKGLNFVFLVNKSKEKNSYGNKKEQKTSKRSKI